MSASASASAPPAAPPVPHRVRVADQLTAPEPEALPLHFLARGEYTQVALRTHLRTKLLSTRAGSPRLPTLPGVQSLSMATRYMDGGRQQFIEIVQMAMLNNEPDACKWWSVYADLTPYARERVSFDDICAASGVEPATFCGELVSTAMRFGRDIANMVAALTHPKVVAAQVKSAERIDGDFAEIAYKDRMAFLQAMGFVPSPKGAMVVNVNASATAQAAAQATAIEPTVPSFAQDLAGAVPAAVHVVTRRSLPEADPSLDAIDAVPIADACPTD